VCMYTYVLGRCMHFHLRSRYANRDTGNHPAYLDDALRKLDQGIVVAPHVVVRLEGQVEVLIDEADDNRAVEETRRPRPVLEELFHIIVCFGILP
jgi:hypothetical protein